MKASLIIPTYNKLPRLKLVIASIAGQKCSKDDFEVIFVDDGSTDGTDEYLKHFELPFQYKYIRKENRGRASARNAAIEVAKNDILIFMDDDVIVHPMFITEHLKEQSSNYKVLHGRILNLTYLKFFEDPSKGIFYSNTMSNLNLSEQLKKKCINEKNVLEEFEKYFGSYNRITNFERVIEILLTKYNSNVDWISFNGGNTSVPRSWLEEVGVFDEKFGKLWGCEDLELGYRLFHAKKNFFYSYTAKNYHIAHYRAGFKEEHNASLSYFYQKHKSNKILCLQDFIEGRIGAKEFIEKILLN